jgi:hypothetical protein
MTARFTATWFRWVIFGAAVLTPSLGRAQNYRELPIGGRTATMGGAGTAAGNDSAMPYLNPAGLAGVPGDIFAVSATAYSYTQRSYQNFFFPSGPPPALGYQAQSESFSTTSIGETPSSVMYFRDLSGPKSTIQHRVGVSLVIPGARSVDLVASASGKVGNGAGQQLETAAITERDTVYYLGPTYAVGLRDWLRLGVSLYGIYRRQVSTNNATLTQSLLGVTVGGYTGQNAQLNESLSFAPIVGMQMRVAPDIWVGLGFMPPSIATNGHSRASTNSSYTTTSGNSAQLTQTSTITTEDLNYSVSEPMRLNVGIALDHRQGFSLALDVHYYAAQTAAKATGVQTYQVQQAGEVTRSYGVPVSLSTQAQDVFDISVGAELALNRAISLRAGFFTDNSSAPAIGTTVDSLYLIRLDRYGGTLGLGLTLGSFDSTAGVVVARGDGRFGALDPYITKAVVPVSTDETTAMFVLSGAVTIKEAQKAIRDALPFEVPLLPDLGGTPGNQAPAPRIPSPLPAEPKPPPPTLGISRQISLPSPPMPGGPLR